mmetsp:Transcript_30867/g.92493  ORF Transcript_30867/g.92493 Transcript_30867/m.92493 type:complete len:393 (+) Transcript_30867:553-1731(+)
MTAVDFALAKLEGRSGGGGGGGDGGGGNVGVGDSGDIRDSGRGDIAGEGSGGISWSTSKHCTGSGISHGNIRDSGRIIDILLGQTRGGIIPPVRSAPARIPRPVPGHARRLVPSIHLMWEPRIVIARALIVLVHVARSVPDASIDGGRASARIPRTVPRRLAHFSRSSGMPALVVPPRTVEGTAVPVPPVARAVPGRAVLRAASGGGVVVAPPDRRRAWIVVVGPILRILRRRPPPSSPRPRRGRIGAPALVPLSVSPLGRFALFLGTPRGFVVVSGIGVRTAVVFPPIARTVPGGAVPNRAAPGGGVALAPRDRRRIWIVCRPVPRILRPGWTSRPRRRGVGAPARIPHTLSFFRGLARLLGTPLSFVVVSGAGVRTAIEFPPVARSVARA